LIALAGCGRYHFAQLPGDGAPDAAIDTVDAVTGHDEDGDGIPDSIDPCPHIAGDSTDSDGDGVGDACDPSPTLARDHWLVFSTMQPGDQPFDDASMFEQKPDSLHFVGDLAPIMTHTFGTVRIDLGFTINGLTGALQHQVAAGVDDSLATVYYFGELNDNAGGTDVAVVSYDMANGYITYDPQTFPSFHTGDGTLRLDAVAGGSPMHTLQAGWVGEAYTSTSPTPGYAGGTVLRLALNGVDIDLRYLALISSN